MSRKVVALRDVATIVRGVTYSADDACDEPLDGFLPILRAGNIKETLFLDGGLVWVPEKLVKSDQVLVPGDIVMCTSSGSADVVGKSAILENVRWRGSFGAFCAVIRAEREKCLPGYLRHLLAGRTFLRWARLSLGANIKNIRKSELERYEFELPPLDQQRRVVAILNKVACICGKREHALRLVDDYLRALFLKMFGDPAKNPKKWRLGTIRDLVSSANYGTSKKAHETEGRLPMLRMNNITVSGRIDLTSLKYVDLDSSEESKYLATRGDLLFNRTNSKELVGKTAVYEGDELMAIAGYLVRVRTNESGSPYYLSAFLNSTYGKQLLKSMCKSIVGMANINAQELQNIEIMLPPRSLQDEYAEVVKRTRAMESRLNASLKNVEALHASLSQRFFA